MVRKSTLKDVAELAGVSIATVSNVLNESKYVGDEVKQKVYQAIEALHYVPNSLAKGLRIKESKLIGLMISDITNSFFASVIRGVEEVLAKNAYNFLLCGTDSNVNKEKEYLKVLLSRRIDGLIVSLAGNEWEHFENIDVPLVFFNRTPDLACYNVVTTNNFIGAYIATEHLIKQHNYRRIAIIAGPQYISVGRERLAGFRRALEDNGYEFNDSLLKIAQFDSESGYKAMKELAEQTLKPDAVLACNNVLTLGAFRFLRESGLIPGEIALIGYDDPEWATIVEPPLTVVRQPAYNLGQQAADVILQCIKTKNNTQVRKNYLDPELIIRKSCGCNRDIDCLG